MISVIIPVRNAALHLSNCLMHIRDSSYNNYEIIVVDDVSNDASVVIAERFGAKVTRLYQHSGPGIARNNGAKIAKGDILFFIDADIIINKDTLVKVYGSLKENEDIAGVVGLYSEIHPNKNFTSCYKNLQVRFEENDKANLISTFRSSVFAIRKNVYIDTGGFKEDRGLLFCEDYDFCLRLGEKKIKFLLDRTMEVMHCKSYTLRELLKQDYTRVLFFCRIFLEKKALQGDHSTIAEMIQRFIKIATLISPGLTLIMIVMALSLKDVRLFMASSILTVIFYVSEYKFFNYLFHSRGFFFTFKAVAIRFIEMLISEAAVIFSLFSREIKKCT